MLVCVTISTMEFCSLDTHLSPAILYSRKYWRELNLAVEPKIIIARILVDLNLAIRYGIAIRICE